ncbi:MAG: glycosyltransferase family 4 protein [Bacteroidota bacterium]
MYAHKSILFVNQHYYPDIAATGQKLTDLAEYLAASGHHVNVICSQGRYMAGALDVPREEVRNGVRIHRTKTISRGRGSTLTRLIDYASFYLRVFFYILFARRYDYIVYLTTPPLLSVLGGVMYKLRGQQYGIWSMDLHPDAEEVLGMLRPAGFASRMLHGLNDFGYRNAEFVVDLGAYMKQRILRKGVLDERLHTIPLWDKVEEFIPVSKEENPLVKELRLEDKFVIMYSGNAGLAHQFDELLLTMEQLKDHPRFFFLFVGSGAQRAHIESFALNKNIRNYMYLDYFPREQLRFSLALADIHLLTLKSEMVGVAVPSKLYSIMASGKPVLMIGPEASDSGEIILQEDAGMVIDPVRHVDKTAEVIAQTLHFLEERQDRCWQLGLNGRRAFTEHYTQNAGCNAWHRLLEEINQEALTYAQ